MKDTVFDFISRMTGGKKDVAELCAATIDNLGEGDVCIPLDDEQRKLLASVPSVAFFAADDTNPAAVRSPFVVAGGLLYTRRNWVYERRIRDWILQSIPTKEDENVTKLPRDPFYAGLLDEQRDAVIAMCNSRFSILTGGPGTGKTFTISRAVKFIHDRKPNFTLGLAAPTAKAADRVKESMLDAVRGLDFAIPQATTIHALLGANYDLVTFKHNRDNPLAFDWLIVDEASMIDLPLMAKLIDAIPATCRLTLAGDADQLASVERGRVFGDLCQFRGISVSHLSQSKRFPPEGPIARLAAAVNGEKDDEALAILKDGSDIVSYANLANLSKGDVFDPEKWPGFGKAVDEGFRYFAECATPSDALAHLNDFRVLCTLRHGPFGSEQIARWIKKRLGKNCPTPMMITRNDRKLEKVVNGAVGVVMPDDPQTLHLPGGSKVRLELLPATELAFASTVHKAQGSEYGDVAIVLPPSAGKSEEENAFNLLTREILYTAITRTKKTVAIWGSDDAIRHCSQHAIDRVSGLVP